MNKKKSITNTKKETTRVAFTYRSASFGKRRVERSVRNRHTTSKIMVMVIQKAPSIN